MIPLRVLVATPLGEGGRGGIDRLMDALRVRLREVRPGNVDIRFMATRGPHHIALAPLFLARAMLHLLSASLLRRVDVVHVNLSSHGSVLRKLVLCRLARAIGVPYVVHLHGSRFRQYFRAASPQHAARIRAMFLGASRIIVLGRIWREFVLAEVPGAAERVTILPNATNPPPAPPARVSNDVGILFLGEVGPRKGVPQLVAALQRLQDHSGWHAIIAGNGEIEATRRALVQGGIADRVTVTGWVDPIKVEALLASEDILVLPSFDENLPMSVIEGMSHGLAVIATPVGAVEDIIQDGETGLIVAVGDELALAAALRRLLADAALRQRLGRRARQFHHDHLDIGPYLARLLTMWHDVAAERHKMVAR